MKPAAWLLVLTLPSGFALAQSWSADPDPRETLDSTRAEERGVLDQLAQLDTDLERVRVDLAALHEREAALDAVRIRHADELASLDAMLQVQRAQVAEQVSELYRLQRRGLARVIFGAEDPADLRRRSVYTLALVDGYVDRLNSFTANVQARRSAVSAVDMDQASLSALRAELQLQDAELKEQRARRIELLDSIRSRREVAMRAMSEMRGARRQLGDRLAGGATSWGGDAPAAGADTFRAAYGRLPWPTTGRIHHRFGTYTDARSGQKAESKGIDVAADYGMPVRCVYPGVVQLADYVPGYGQTVAVQHGSYTTVYAHLNGIKVRKGQNVTDGHVLGLVGNTGLTDGAGYMLTFEVRYNGTAQDPLTWLRSR